MTGTSILDNFVHHDHNGHRHHHGYHRLPTQMVPLHESHPNGAADGHDPLLVSAEDTTHTVITRHMSLWDEPSQPSLPRKRHESRKEHHKKAELKTSVFDTYAVCAALLASFCCATPLVRISEMQEDDIYKYVAIIAQQCMVRMCTIGAIHAMLVFCFSSLYSKSALARMKYGVEVFERFSHDTASVRSTAFWSMYYTAILYCVQVVVSSVYSFPTPASWTICGCLLLMVSFLIHQTQKLVLAASVVFLADEDVEKFLEAHGDLDMFSQNSSDRSSDSHV